MARNGQYRDLSGERKGRWQIVARSGVDIHGGSVWLCRCDCGTTKIVSKSSLKGGSNSCGCLMRERVTVHGMHRTPTYRCWLQMTRRCRDPKSDSYRNYGGRGITVCGRWYRFVNFFEDLGERPTPQHTIGRIDNDGNYEPDNCRWETLFQQANNKRNNRRLTWRGKTLTISQWAREQGVSRSLINGRIERGWVVERALTVPARPQTLHRLAAQ